MEHRQAALWRYALKKCKQLSCYKGVNDHSEVCKADATTATVAAEKALQKYRAVCHHDHNTRTGQSLLFVLADCCQR
jgi:hypothetical protein